MFRKTASYLPLACVLGLLAGLIATFTDSGWIVGVAAFLLVLLFGMFRDVQTEIPELPPEQPAPLSTDLPLGFGRAMLRGLPSPLIVLSRKGRVIYANSAAHRNLLPHLGARKPAGNPKAWPLPRGWAPSGYWRPRSARCPRAMISG